ncbi:GMC family oxidoreductase [Nissabacter sp. SGAir0207]|uniref:GMC family oxidoreductase n=1 Tax=Nissabacter sp. SGAir0207 TaxID=2126321 RepID=UPI0010CCD999|nr:GMC family oxidoreductase [Nissabacter sp. SGAir0207]QCR38564.1 choline dehydrogenase [Nissabacter sp. SGAir0207]
MAIPSESTVVIVGTGVVGVVIAEQLLDAGIPVLMLEAGPRVPRAEIVENYRNLPLAAKGNPIECYPSRDWAPHPEPAGAGKGYLQLSGADSYAQSYVRYAGGSTWHWAGTCWRLTPADMQLHSRYGVGRDWPFEYATLEPYYARAEHKLGVCGPDDPALQWPPLRSRPYPMPALPFGPGEARFTEVVKELGYHNIPCAQARNSGMPYDDRPACCANNNCVPVCPVGAKYDAATALSRLEAKGAVIVENAVVWRVETNARNQIEAVHYYDPQKQSHRVTGKLFVLACNGLENPKLLLMSADARNPNGLANSSDQVGRNMMDHPQITMTVTLEEPYWAGVGPVVNSGIMETSQGDFRSEHAGAYFRFNNFARNRFVTFDALKKGLVGKALDEEIRRMTACTADIVAAHEILPDANNRLTLSSQKDWLGLPKPAIHYDVGDYVRRSARDYSLPIARNIAAAMGATDMAFSKQFNQSKHIMGGTIMGLDPATSVVDADCRAHDHRNLFLPGGGAMPSTACGNSTLTMVALAFKAADALVAQAREAV